MRLPSVAALAMVLTLSCCGSSYRTPRSVGDRIYSATLASGGSVLIVVHEQAVGVLDSWSVDVRGTSPTLTEDLAGTLGDDRQLTATGATSTLQGMIIAPTPLDPATIKGTWQGPAFTAPFVAYDVTNTYLGGIGGLGGGCCQTGGGDVACCVGNCPCLCTQLGEPCERGSECCGGVCNGIECVEGQTCASSTDQVDLSIRCGDDAQCCSNNCVSVCLLGSFAADDCVYAAGVCEGAAGDSHADAGTDAQDAGTDGPSDPCGAEGTWNTNCGTIATCGMCGSLDDSYTFTITSELAAVGGESGNLSFDVSSCTATVTSTDPNYCGPPDRWILHDGAGTGTAGTTCTATTCMACQETACTPTRQ